MDSISLNGVNCAPESIPILVSKVVEAIQGMDCASMALGVRWPANASQEQIDSWKKAIQFPLTQSLAEQLHAVIDFQQPNLWITIDFVSALAQFQWSSLFVQGNYVKLRRNIAQTRHDCRHCRGRGCSTCLGSGKTTADSVQELLASVALPYVQAQALVFHGAGREDVDVRMLGTGRPFIMEWVEPRFRSKSLEHLEASINQSLVGKVLVFKLRYVPIAAVAELKQSQHDKEYEALVSLSQPVDDGSWKPFLNQPISIEQRTPNRVSKRRSDAIRTRSVTLLSVQPVDDNHIRIRLRTAHGTYVKEWISGDDGRTTPSLSSLLSVSCHCAELDVLAILVE